MQFKFAIEKHGKTNCAVGDCEFAGVHPLQQMSNAVLVGATDKTIFISNMGKWVGRNISPLKNSEKLILVPSGQLRSYPTATVKLVLIDADGKETPEFDAAVYFSTTAVETFGDSVVLLGSIGKEDLEKHSVHLSGRRYEYWEWK